ncbi:MAG: Holliday junction resolvase RuvX, partial [Thermostichales cyanobacterium SRBZ-1_bins_19]
VAAMSPIFALGLDVGNPRIGVAGCDPRGRIATGLGVIHRRNLKADRLALQTWIQQRQANQLIVGLPYLEDGSLGTQAQKIQRFITALNLDIPITYVDERLTTFAAQEHLQALGIPRRRWADLIDQVAAQIILQEWLDRQG